MTLHELVETLKAYEIVLPDIKDQHIFDIKITDTGEIKISLDLSTLRIAIT